MSDNISRQAAIDAIDCNIVVTGRENAETVAATIGTFVDRIKALPSADSNAIQCIQRVGSVDLISRQAVLHYPIRLDHYDEEHGNRDFVLGIESVMEYVESLPSAEPKEVYCPMASRTCFANGKEVAWCMTCPHISEEDRELVKKAVEGSQPNTGRWIENPMLPDAHRYECPNCHAHHRERYDFCPSCGKYMRGGKHER